MNKSVKRIIIGFIVVNIIAYSAVVIYRRQTQTPAPKGAMVGRKAPDFELPQLGATSAPIALADKRGKVVVLDFWATWCPPCRKQMPVIQTLADDPKLDQTVAIISVNADQPSAGRADKVAAFVDDHHYSFPTVLDDGRAGRAFGLSALPTLVVIGPDGTIVRREVGAHTEADLRQMIDAATIDAVP